MEIRIKGIMKSKSTIVSLDEFFESPVMTEAIPEGAIVKQMEKEPEHWVKVKLLPPFTAAEIQELTYQNVKVHGDKSTSFNIPAETRMQIRKKKLGYGLGVEDHNLKHDDGEIIAWDEHLWRYLDSINPAILQKVVKAIDSDNTVEGEVNPT